MRKSVSIGIVLLLVTFFCVVCVNAAPVFNLANGHYYEGVCSSGLISWPDAKSAAESMSFKGTSGHLATIEDASENDFIFNQVVHDQDCLWVDHDWFGLSGPWLGGSDSLQEGTWVWVTGEPWVYSNFMPGEPNNAYGDEDYLHFQSWVDSPPDGKDPRWNDAGPGDGEIKSKMAGYVVEYERVDKIPPVTTHQISGYDKTDVHLTLIANDEESGVDQTFYELFYNNGLSSRHEGTFFSINLDEINKISYYSIDVAGNEEKKHEITIESITKHESQYAHTVYEKGELTNPAVKYWVDLDIHYFKIIDETSKILYIESVSGTPWHYYTSDFTLDIIAYDFYSKNGHIWGPHINFVGFPRNWENIGIVDWSGKTKQYTLQTTVRSDNKYFPLFERKELVPVVISPGGFIFMGKNYYYSDRDFTTSIK